MSSSSSVMSHVYASTHFFRTPSRVMARYASATVTSFWKRSIRATIHLSDNVVSITCTRCIARVFREGVESTPVFLPDIVSWNISVKSSNLLPIPFNASPTQGCLEDDEPSLGWAGCLRFEFMLLVASVTSGVAEEASIEVLAVPSYIGGISASSDATGAGAGLGCYGNIRRGIPLTNVDFTQSENGRSSSSSLWAAGGCSCDPDNAWYVFAPRAAISIKRWTFANHGHPLLQKGALPLCFYRRNLLATILKINRLYTFS